MAFGTVDNDFSAALRTSAWATPCYVFCPDSVAQSYEKLRALLGTSLVVSLKANPHLDLYIRCAHAFVDGVELASMGELETVVGRVKGKKYVNNPAMDKVFIKAAVSSRCTIVIDNLAQVEMLADVLKGKTVDAMLRVNAAACVPATLARKASDHFGMSSEDAMQAASRLAEMKCNLIGLHSFGGSNNLLTYGTALAEGLARIAGEIEFRTGTRIAQLNLGGGFGADWEAHQAEIAAYATALAPLKSRFELLHESGRAIFAKAGVFINRVVAVKTLNGECIAICDGGMNQNFMLARTEGSMRKYASPVVIDGQTFEPLKGTGGGMPVRFVGNTCNRQDVVGYETIPAALPRPGDLCLFTDCGAYNHTYTVAPFLSLKPAAVYIYTSALQANPKIVDQSAVQEETLPVTQE